MRVIFPQAQTADGDPVSMMSLKNFKENMESAIKSHKRDKNLFMVAPIPIGYSTLGGEGRSLLVSQEIQQAEQHNAKDHSEEHTQYTCRVDQHGLCG